jgi:hypothetical protein
VNFVKIIKALPEKARRWYLSLVFDVTLDSELNLQLEALKLTLQLHQLAEDLGVELRESPPKPSIDQIAALRAQVDELKTMLSQRENQEE